MKNDSFRIINNNHWANLLPSTYSDTHNEEISLDTRYIFSRFSGIVLSSIHIPVDRPMVKERKKEREGHDAILQMLQPRVLLFFMWYSLTLLYLSVPPREERPTGFIVGVREYEKDQERASGACAVLGVVVRVVATASLRVIPLVGVRPGHAKRVMLAELSRRRKDRADRRWYLLCAREEGGLMVPRQRGVLQ